MVWQIGARVPATELTDCLEVSGVRSKNPDEELSILQQNIRELHWRIDHVAYKPRSRFYVRGQPVFQFVLTHPDSSDPELFEVPYGPQVRDFVLENCASVFYVRNIRFWEERGYSRERLYL
jgi:hypothetical protein